MTFIDMPMIKAPATTGAFFVAGMLAIGLYVDARGRAPDVACERSATCVRS